MCVPVNTPEQNTDADSKRFATRDSRFIGLKLPGFSLKKSAGRPVLLMRADNRPGRNAWAPLAPSASNRDADVSHLESAEPLERLRINPTGGGIQGLKPFAPVDDDNSGGFVGGLFQATQQALKSLSLAPGQSGTFVDTFV